MNFSFLFCLDAEPMLLVDDQQAQVFEFYVLLQEPVSADYHVDGTFPEPFHNGGLLFLGAKSAEHLYDHRIIFKPVDECLVVLLGEYCSRDEHGHLFAVHDDLERGAERDLGLSETDVTADDTVHRSFSSQVLEDLVNSAQLSFCLFELKPFFHLAEKLILRRVRMPLGDLAFGVELDQLLCDIFDVCFDLARGDFSSATSRACQSWVLTFSPPMYFWTSSSESIGT